MSNFLFKLVAFLVGVDRFLYAEIKDEPVTLLSYPRSGNTWIRYCIEYITKRPTGEAPYIFALDPQSTHMNSPLGNSFDLSIDLNKPRVIKEHGWNGSFSQNTNYLILIIRNYKECIIRETGSYQSSLNFLLNPNYFFINNIRVYDYWDSDKKLLLYYEDILTDLKTALLKIADFFHEGHENIQPFLDNLEVHQKNALEIYNKFEHSITQGLDIHFHANKLTHEQRLILDEVCENADLEIYNQYLKRYKEG